MSGFVVTMNNEKAFDTLNYSFLTLVLKKISFGQNFMNWIENSLKDQKSCTINEAKTTPYFTLHRGSHKDDPVSAFLFIYPLFKNVLFFN